MGKVLSDLKRHEEALDCYIQAYEMRQKLYPQDHVQVAESMKYVGIVLYHLKRLPEAKGYLKQSFEIFTKQYSSDHPESQKALGALLITLKK